MYHYIRALTLTHWSSTFNLTRNQFWMKYIFEKWITKAIDDILVYPEKYIELDQTLLRNHFDSTFGKALSAESLMRYGREFGKIAERRDFRYDSATQDITTNSGGQPYKPHTYFGDSKN